MLHVEMSRFDKAHFHSLAISICNIESLLKQADTPAVLNEFSKL